MILKKRKGRSYGANFTRAEQRGMDAEIRKQMAEHTRKHNNEIDAMILWVLHEHFGWGPKRLKRFHDRFAEYISDLVKKYEMNAEDDVWLCTRKLKDAGIDIEEWNKEEQTCSTNTANSKTEN